MCPAEPSSESPKELVERISSGTDREAEDHLVRRYSSGLRLLLKRHTRTATEAEDLLQETLHLALSKLRGRQLRDPSKLVGFLASLARNLAIEHYRKATRRRTEPDSEAIAAAQVPGDQLGELMRREEATLVRQTLDEMEVERDREVLLRFYIAEEDRDAIAADLGLTGLQLNRILHRARQRYKARYLTRRETLDRRQASTLLLVLLLAAGAIVRWSELGRC